MKKACIRFMLLLAAICGMSPPTMGAVTPEAKPGESFLHQPPPEPRFSKKTVRLPLIEGGTLDVRRLTTADGLSQSRVSQIVQDRQGFMWFGTQYGLNRFDGHEFKLFVHEAGQDNSLSGAYIFSLFEDRDGFLWVGCSQTLDRFDPRSETYKHYHIDADASASLGGTVFHISQDHTGKLWLATGNGLFSLDPNTGALTHFAHAAENPGGLSTNNIKWTGEDHAGHLWVGTADGLDQFDPATATVRFHIPNPDPNRVSFFEDREGLFWITNGTGTGLAIYDVTSNTVTRYSFYEHEPPPDSVSGVNEMIEDADGNLWIATQDSGVLQFDRQRRQFVHYNNLPLNSHSVAVESVITMFRDRDGNIWVGLDDGSSVFRVGSRQFQSFRHASDASEPVSSDVVSAIYDDSKGSLWIGNRDGLERIDRKTGKRVAAIGDRLGKSPIVDALTEDRKGVLWLGTFRYGLVSYDPVTQRYKQYRHSPNDPTSLSSDEVHVVFFDHHGTLWICTDDGLDRFDPETQQFHAYKVESASTSSQRYIAIAEDARGILWLGTHDSGLHEFDPATGQFRVYKPDPNNPASLRDAMTPSVHVSSSGVIWIATQNGLNELDPRTGRFSAFDVRNGLPSNMIDCILEDDNNNLWLSTNKGLSKFNLANQTFANYTVIDGLPGNDLTAWSACHKNNLGELFFGGFAGAVAFDPHQLLEPPYVPTLVLTDFQLAGAPIAVGPGSVLQQSIAFTDSITLNHEQNIFSVTFAALQYFDSASVRYRYRLEGLSPQWYEVDGNSRKAAFTTLPSGRYTFRVQSKNTRGSWIEPGIALSVVVLPPWWSTWWIRTLYVLAAVLIIAAAFRMRLAQLSRQLSIRMEERLNERTRIAQDLHDTLLQGLLGASMQLEVAGGRLANDSAAKPLIERVVDSLRVMINESRNTVRGLRISRFDSDDLEKAISLIPKDLGASNAMQFHVLVEGSKQHVRAPIRNEVFWIAREAIANALRHSRGTLVEAVIEYSKDRLRMIVRDDGCGMDPDTLRSGRENHWGLQGIRERTRRMDGTLNVTSAIGGGTEIELTIPGASAFERSPGAAMLFAKERP